MNTELLESLCLATAVSGDEHDVRQLLISRLEGVSDEIRFDGLGSVIARKGSRGPKIAIVGHMDEVGFIVKHISADGFIRFDTIGSWWNQSMLNHQVAIRTRSGASVPGLIGSIAPHALSDKQKQQPVEHGEMFIDIGAASAAEVAARGVAVGDFISPQPNFARWGDDRIVAKALDNRVGCALMVELMQRVNNPEITLFGTGTVEEEVGLRGAQTSAETSKPDLVIVLDTAVAGDIPGIDPVHFPLKLGAGPGIMLFDKRYFANQKLVAAYKEHAEAEWMPWQLCTMKTGATDGGRYNVMGGGRPVISMCLPTRYLHANSAMISIRDYDALLNTLARWLNQLDSEQVAAYRDFR